MNMVQAAEGLPAYATRPAFGVRTHPDDAFSPQLFKRHPQAMCVVAPLTLAVLAMNDAASRQFGVRLGSDSRVSLFDLLDEGEQERLFRLTQVESRRNGEAKFCARGKNGRAGSYLSATWSRCRWAGREATLWMLSDQMALEKTRQAARTAGEDATTLLEHSPAGICRYNVEGDQVEYANALLAGQFGLAAAAEMRV